MIVVKIEMWPRGDESRAVEFARAVITNQVDKTLATGGARGDYDVELKGGVYGRENPLKGVWKRGKVVGFDRMKRGVWDLLYQALANTVGGRSALPRVQAQKEGK